MGFKFSLQQKVVIATSGEQGEIVGRAEYTSSANNYLIRYQAADGRATEAWWQEDALSDV